MLKIVGGTLLTTGGNTDYYADETAGRWTDCNGQV
jgi:hypothetical protein